MLKFIKDCLTEDDGESWCFAKVTTALTITSYLANTTYSIYLGHAPNLLEFGEGLAAVIGAGAALIAAKQATQVPSKQKDN